MVEKLESLMKKKNRLIFISINSKLNIITALKIMASQWSLTIATAFLTTEKPQRTVIMSDNTKMW